MGYGAPAGRRVRSDTALERVSLLHAAIRVGELDGCGKSVEVRVQAADSPCSTSHVGGARLHGSIALATRTRRPRGRKPEVARGATPRAAITPTARGATVLGGFGYLHESWYVDWIVCACFFFTGSVLGLDLLLFE